MLKVERVRLNRPCCRTGREPAGSSRKAGHGLPSTQFLQKNTGKVDIRSQRVSDQRQGPLTESPWGMCSRINKEIRLVVTEDGPGTHL